MTQRLLPVLAVMALALTTLVVAAPSASSASVTGLDPFEFTEGGGPVPVAPNAVITESGSFADGYIQFAVQGATETETLFLPSADAPDPTEGAVSVVGDAVYLGLGNGDYKQIGTVDTTNDGQDGRPLRINFSAALPNSDFSEGVDANGTPTAWTVNREHITLGALASKTQGRNVTISGTGPYTITGPGYSFQTDFNYAATNDGWKKEGLEKPLTNAGSWSSQVTSHGGESQALRLWFTTNCQGPGYTAPYCSVFGPDAWSSPFDAKAGDDLAFDWAAANGGDDYEVYGFLVNTATNDHTELMYGRGFQQDWTTATGQIPADGTYRFRFVTGSFDRTGGLAIGASLYIDNIRVVSSDASAAVAQAVARMVHYDNSSDDPPTTRSITVETKVPGEPATTETITADITPVDDPPSIGAMATVTLVNTMAEDTFADATGTVPGTDPESDPITYEIDGGSAVSVTISGVDYDTAKTGTYGTLYLASSSGAYRFVADADAVNARTSDDAETFTIVATANGLTGQGDLTVAVSVPPSAPSAPTGLTATGGDEVVDLEWAAPTWLGGSAVTGYRIEVDTGSGWTVAVADTGSAATTYQLTGLTNGVEVDVRVSAINATGTSAPSDVATATPLATPDAPTALAATPGDGSADLSWDAPADDGGAPITGYRIEVSTDGSTWSVAVADTGSVATTHTVTGLTNGTATSFRVSAINEAGVGATSAIASTTPRTVPSEPLEPTATPSDGEVSLFWLAPLSDGGAPITGYRVEVSTDGSTWTDVVADTGSSTTAYTVTGLTNGTATSFRVSAINVAGEGPASAVAGATPRTVAGAPTITSITAGNRTLTVAFAAPSDDGGAPVLNYEYSVDGGVTWKARQPASTTSPLVIQPLANGTTYPVLLRAVNAAGSGPASGSVPGTPTLGVVPVPKDTKDPSSGGGSNGRGGGKSSASVLVGGEPVSATTAVGGQDGADGVARGTVRTTGGGVTVDVGGVDDDGTSTGTDPSGRLVVTRGGSTVVSGSGFLPGSTVDVWLVGSNLLLGEVTVGADGTFTATFELPDGVELGADEIQLNGVGADNRTRTVSVDVVVKGATEERESTGSPERSRSLAVTGGDVVTFLLVGLVLCLAGSSIHLSARRRRTAVR